MPPILQGLKSFLISISSSQYDLRKETYFLIVQYSQVNYKNTQGRRKKEHRFSVG